MSKQINDGGTAFPQSQHAGDVGLSEGGMSLRDYFAAKAMQALITGLEGGFEWWAVATDAYAMADAMLAARDTDTTER